jgi:hypothetical protein
MIGDFAPLACAVLDANPPALKQTVVLDETGAVLLTDGQPVQTLTWDDMRTRDCAELFDWWING